MIECGSEAAGGIVDTFITCTCPHFSQESVGGWGFSEIVYPRIANVLALVTTIIVEFDLLFFQCRILRRQRRKLLVRQLNNCISLLK